MKINGKQSLTLLAVMPVLLLVQLSLGINIYYKIKHTEAIERNNNKLDLYLKTNTKYVSFSESAIRGYLLTEDNKYFESYKTDLEEWKKNQACYDSLSEEVTRPEVNEIQALSRQKLAVMAQTMQYYKGLAKDSALNIIKSGQGQLLMDSLRSKSALLRNALSTEVTNGHNGVNQLLFAFFIVIAVMLALSLFFAWYTYRAINSYTNGLEKSVTGLQQANEKIQQINSEFQAAGNSFKQLAFISASDLKLPIELTFSTYRFDNPLASVFPVKGNFCKFVVLSEQPDWLLIKLNQTFHYHGAAIDYVIIKRVDKMPVIKGSSNQLVHFKLVPDITRVRDEGNDIMDFQEEVFALCE
jgi:CHASE3 domain sensor protein